MNQAEQYAAERVEDLTKEIAGCLTPATLTAIIDDIEDNHTTPILVSLKRFAERLTAQRDSLIGTGSGPSPANGPYGRII